MPVEAEFGHKNQYTSGQSRLYRRKCPECGQLYTMLVDDGELQAHQSGVYAQNAFAGRGRAYAEQIMTGIHDDCWDALFAGLEDDE
jgi:hypothetical protein